MNREPSRRSQVLAVFAVAGIAAALTQSQLPDTKNCSFHIGPPSDVFGCIADIRLQDDGLHPQVLQNPVQ